jgi:hypothetical protein
MFAQVLRLLERLKASRRQFKYFPIGPVGAHLELKRSEWVLLSSHRVLCVVIYCTVLYHARWLL